MSSIILKTKDLNLPEPIATKLKGTRVEVVETGDGILLRPLAASVLSARGILKGKGLTTKEFAELTKEDKSREG